MSWLDWFGRGRRDRAREEISQAVGWAPGFEETGAAAPTPVDGTPRGTAGGKDAFDAAIAAFDLGKPTQKPPRAKRAPGEPQFRDTGRTGHRERLRERLFDRGQNALHDYELLEMLLFFAMRKGDTKPLAKALINRFGSFGNVLTAPQRTLLETSGLGTHSIAALKLVQEAAVRMINAELLEQPVLNRWDRLMDYLNSVMAREKIEQFRVLFLDSKNRLLADDAQARGTVNHTAVYPREVVKRALEMHATALILVHIHPFGDPTPSRADLEMTRELKAAAAIMGIVLHDRVVVGNGRSLSFRADGLL